VFDSLRVDHPTDACTVEETPHDRGTPTEQEEGSARDGRRRTDQEDARAVHSASHPGGRGFQVIEPTWNPGRFNHRWGPRLCRDGLMVCVFQKRRLTMTYTMDKIVGMLHNTSAEILGLIIASSVPRSKSCTIQCRRLVGEMRASC